MYNNAAADALSDVIGALETWQHRPDAPEAVQSRVNALKSQLIQVLDVVDGESDD